jgi:glucose-6-phosphate 1-dehydrogenase
MKPIDTSFERCTIILIGASGDLSIRKVMPALFSIFCHHMMPPDFRIIGFARSEMTDEEFRERASSNLTCRYVSERNCDERKKEFLSRCFYQVGKYDDQNSFAELRKQVEELEGGSPSNRIFYMAIPPSIFLETSASIGASGFLDCDQGNCWSRVVIEKPFGEDSESSRQLSDELAKIFTEQQTYRIDHYLGKEVIQNLMVLRFANLIFEPLWSHEHIDSVQITWAEDFGIEGRAGYFDQYGIIRDVMQNHLMQMLALVAMEPPVSLAASDIGNEKVKLLRCVQPIQPHEIVIGQYGATQHGGWSHISYLEEHGVSENSRTETYAAALLRIRNRRWDKVPFLIRAGKAMNAQMTEIRIRFKPTPGNIFNNSDEMLPHNELVIRVQPDEAIYFRVINKIPGLPMEFELSNLDLQYKSAYRQEIPDAYERLILDVIRGDKSLFIRGDELDASWDIFTPVLKDFETRKLKPEIYPYNSAGPDTANALASKSGTHWSLLTTDG